MRKILLGLFLLVLMVVGLGARTNTTDAEVIVPLFGGHFTGYNGVSDINLPIGLSCATVDQTRCNEWALTEFYAVQSWADIPAAINPYTTSYNFSTNRIVVRASDASGCFQGFCKDPNNKAETIFLTWGNQRVDPYTQNWDKALIIIGSWAYATCNGNQNCLFDKQAVVAHEIGHALSLRHVTYNGYCGDAYYYQSIMDYDCFITFRINNGPRNQDICGVQQVFYDPFRFGTRNCGMP